MAIDITKAALRIAERLRDKATEQGRIPFDRGDLRKSIKSYSLGLGKAAVGSELPYARAVHDGRGRVTITPNLRSNPPLGKRKLVKTFGKKKVVMSKGDYQKYARLKFQVGGRTVFARKVEQPPRRGRPFIQEGAVEMNREGYDWLMPGLMKETTAGLAKKFAGSIKLTVTI